MCNENVKVFRSIPFNAYATNASALSFAQFYT